MEGTPSLMAAVEKYAKSKPIIAAVNGWAGSAMYWVVSAATKIVATDSSMVGSIGVIATHVDDSKALEDAGYKVDYITSTESPYKAEGVGPMGDETREFTQKRVDQIHERFVSALSKNRKVSKSHVNSEFGRGRMFYAEEAMAKGMIDQVGSMDDVLDELSRKQRNKNRARAAKYRRQN